MKLRMAKHWKFFSLTLSWSWILWGICIVFGFSISNGIGMICYILGAVAPSSVGIILARLEKDRNYWDSFFRRLIDFKRIQSRWYLIIFGLIPAVIVGSVLTNYLVSGNIPSFTVLGNYLKSPVSLVGFALATLIGGPLFEELGWRGYGLDQLRERYNLIWSGLIVTFFWVIWHLPLFMVAGTLQSALLDESFISFLSYNVEIFSYGILVVWIYNNNSKSILSAILFHFSINFFAGITSLPTGVKHFETIIQLIIAISILIYWKNSDSTTIN